ncbi:MAG: DMT family transporter [Phycisphaeraceae bacterium]|nr:DMT family transporter [Phycisphaeraceae bacterium]
MPQTHGHHDPPPTGLATGVVTVLLTLLGWSCVPLFLRYFAQSIDAWTSNGWRYGAAALIWLPVAVFASRNAKARRSTWKAALIPAAFNATAQVCFTWAHYLIEPGLLTFGLRLQILCVAIGAYLLFPGERLVIRSRAYLTGFVLVLGGVLGTALLGENPFEGAHAMGFLLAAGSGALFAGYALAVKRCLTGVHPVIAFSLISQYTGAALIALMLALGAHAGAGAITALTVGQFGLLILSAIIGIALGHVFYYTAIARLGVAVSSGVIQLQPFIVAAASYFFFGEVLTTPQWISGSVAVSGAILMLVAQRRINRNARAARAALVPDELPAILPEPEPALVTVRD